MSGRLWILGADDPEMQRIEELLRSRGEDIAYARADGGRRIYPSEAYSLPTIDLGAWGERPSEIIFVECAAQVIDTSLWHGMSDEHDVPIVYIDHHRPGDPGHGMPPEDFMSASSVGQVYAHLLAPPSRVVAGTRARFRHEHEDGWSVYADIYIDARDDDDAPRVTVRVRIPHATVLAAAADHCLAAAYAGQCPGVDPDELREWRVLTRAEYQHRAVEALQADIDAAMDVLRQSPQMADGVFDLRGRGRVPELPEAACILGVGYLAEVEEQSGRHKIVVGGAAPADFIGAFLRGEIAEVIDTYGDPARGFAGGYLR